MSHLTNFEVFLLLSVLKVGVVLVITLVSVAYTVLLERKLLGRMQNELLLRERNTRWVRDRFRSPVALSGQAR